MTIDLKPDFAEAWCNKAFALRGLGRFEEALKAFDKAVEIKSGPVNIWCEKAFTHTKLGQFEEALKAFEKAVEFNSKWDLAHKNLGVVYFQFLNRKIEGLAHLKEALKLNPEISQANEIRRLIKHQEKSIQ